MGLESGPKPDGPPPKEKAPRFGLGTRILIGMVIGAGAGAFFGERAAVLEPVGDLFIRLLLMAAIPLVFFNLLAGLTALTDLRTFGRLSAKIVSYYLVTTATALTLGLTAMHIVKPGVGKSSRRPGSRVTRQMRSSASSPPAHTQTRPGSTPC